VIGSPGRGRTDDHRDYLFTFYFFSRLSNRLITELLNRLPCHESRMNRSPKSINLKLKIKKLYCV